MPDEKREAAAQKRAAAANDPAMVEALLRERQGYVVRGLDDRVAQVDEQIRAHGGTPPAEDKPARRSRRATAEEA